MNNKSNMLPFDKGDPEYLIVNLSFALFGHQPEYRAIKGDRRKILAQYSTSVISVINLIFERIKSRRVEIGHYDFFDEEYFYEFFNGKKFYHLKKSLEENKVNFKGKKNKHQRAVFRMILKLCHDAFAWNVTHPVVDEIRRRIEYDRHSKVDVSGQIKSINQLLAIIIDFMERNPPDTPVTYDGVYNRPIIKTDQAGNFLSPSDAKRSGTYIEGRYTIYRKAFVEQDNQYKYVLEPLTIKLRAYGTVFELKSKNAGQDEYSRFQGVGFFLNKSFWLVGHSKDIYPRMRVMAGNTDEWRKLKMGQENNCAALSVQSHINQNELIHPRHCYAVGKLQQRDDASSPFLHIPRFVKREEILDFISEAELSRIDS